MNKLNCQFKIIKETRFFSHSKPATQTEKRRFDQQGQGVEGRGGRGKTLSASACSHHVVWRRKGGVSNTPTPPSSFVCYATLEGRGGRGKILSASACSHDVVWRRKGGVSSTPTPPSSFVCYATLEGRGGRGKILSASACSHDVVWRRKGGVSSTPTPPSSFVCYATLEEKGVERWKGVAWGIQPQIYTYRLLQTFNLQVSHYPC
ncbi:hypothetical protein SUGI_1191450 [Cryptomeria japonica]|nr:hypothetical protein SUGI_1191450 [Cryptomeria japonica]